MGDQISIKMQDGFELTAYRSMPSAESKGVVVVIQEIFGVNAHIREVADGYAAQGYSAIAPALFDRIERDIELGYAEADMSKGIKLAFEGLEMAQTMKDLQSVVDHGAAKGATQGAGQIWCPTEDGHHDRQHVQQLHGQARARYWRSTSAKKRRHHYGDSRGQTG